MRELKYYKDLPVRPLNKVTYPLCLAGADCYIDIEGNKYAFISFRNATKKPFFSLYFMIKEYNAGGSLIKETKFSVPNTYGRKGLYVIPEPVAIEQECEGIEVFIYLSEFNKKTFHNDSWTKRGAEKILQEPKVTTTSSVPFEVQPTKDELLRAEKIANGELVEEKKDEAKPVIEEKSELVENKAIEPQTEEKKESSATITSESNFYHRDEQVEEKVEEPSNEAETQEAKPEFSENEVEENVTTKVYEIKNTNSHFLLPFILGLAFAAGLLFVILNYNIVLNAFRELCYKLGIF